MREMEEKILKEGKILSGGILKVGSFLNQKIDVIFLKTMGKEISELYKGAGANKILTIESSGIAIAVATGMEMNIPVVFAKKHRTSNVDGEAYVTRVHSFTHNEDYQVVVSKEYLVPSDRILLIDDFLANGNAVNGLIELVNQAGAEVIGIAAAIEKVFQGGGDELRAKGYRVESLAEIEIMSESGIIFRHNLSRNG